MASSVPGSTNKVPPIVYTIAGSDSGGGAGIQADLHAMHAFGCHGCSAITCLTAQSSVGVSNIHAPPKDFLQSQLDTLYSDLPPRAIKIGMLGTQEMAETVGSFLQKIIKNGSGGERPFVVLDPVMITTSGHKLIDEKAEQALKKCVFPYIDVLTPNKFEAEALLGRKFSSFEDVEQGAKDLLAMGVKSVLIKGGHTLSESSSPSSSNPTSLDVNATVGYAQDYFLSSVSTDGEARLCDGASGVWLRTDRFDSENTHGTGCTLSSSIASALALGHSCRENSSGEKEGATSAMDVVDACCLAKAYVTAGIARGVQLGQGPGPVVHTEFPDSYPHYPSITLQPNQVASTPFRPMRAFDASADDDVPKLGRILPIVDTVDWVKKLASSDGITDIQLRVKDETEYERILERVKMCQRICHDANVRLWINDHWKAAVEAGCFGVHLGQEDLYKCIQAGGMEEMKQSNVALGISTHSYGELSAALGVKPSYISMGPVFGTLSKKVAFEPQGLTIVRRWRRLIPPDIPFVTIGGIGGPEAAQQNRAAGADCVAVIGAVTQAKDVQAAVSDLNNAMS